MVLYFRRPGGGEWKQNVDNLQNIITLHPEISISSQNKRSFEMGESNFRKIKARKVR